MATQFLRKKMRISVAGKKKNDFDRKHMNRTQTVVLCGWETTSKEDIKINTYPKKIALEEYEPTGVQAQGEDRLTVKTNMKI